MDKRLIFTTSTEIVRVPADTVVHITADGNYSAINMADGGCFVLTLQLGQIERRIADMLDRDYIAFINPPRQKMVLSDCRTFRHEVSASKEALKALKELLEKEALK